MFKTRTAYKGTVLLEELIPDPNETNIVIPDSISEISFSAFDKIGMLDSIAFPKNYNNFLPSDIFEHFKTVIIDKENEHLKLENGCVIKDGSFITAIDPNEVKLVIPEGVTGGFEAHKGLKSVHFPSSYNYAIKFGSCPNLENITVDSANSHLKMINGCLIFDGKVQYVLKQTKEIVIPDGVVDFERESMIDCGDIIFTIPTTFTNLSSTITNKASKIIIQDEHPVYTESDGIITQRDNEKYQICFVSHDITDLVIPEGITEFAYCCNSFSWVTSIHFPSSYTSEYGNFPIRYCMRLNKITVDDSNPIFKAIDGYLMVKKEGYESGLHLKYVIPTISDIVVPDGVTHIFEYSFINHDITSVFLPDSVICIDNETFKGCTKLKKVHLSASLVEIGKTLINDSYSAIFMDCISLEEIDIPNGVKKIGPASFKNCTALKRVSLPDTLKSIDVGAFSGCSSLTTINTPESLSYVDKGAFDNTPVHEIVSGVGYFRQFATDLADDVYDIDIREGTVCFPKRGFFGTTDYYKPVNAKANYGTITIPSTLEDIDPFELSYCECINVSENNPNYSSDDGVMFDKRKTTLLKFPMTKKCDRYTIPDSVTRIDNRAFQNCRDIFCVVIPESVKEIESSAFSYTNNLGEIWLPESIEKIGDFAFDCDLYSGHHSISRYHDHDVMIFLYKGEIAVPFALQGNWRKNKEEEILDRFICDKGEKREEYFKQLKSSAYKIPLALFMALVYPEYETFQAYAKRNIKTIISDVVEDNVKLMDQVLKLGYITKKNIDAIIEVSDSSGFSNVADILRKYKETLSTPKKTTKKKAGN